MGMGDVIKSLEVIDESLKTKQQKKLEDRQRIQETIDKIHKRQSEL